MTKSIIISITVCLITFSSRPLKAQLLGECHPDIICQDYFGYVGNGEIIPCIYCTILCNDFEICGYNIINPPSTFGFVAVDPHIEFSFTTDVELNVGLVSEDWSECIASEATCNNGIETITISSDELEIGKKYVIIVFGCNLGSAGTMTLEIADHEINPAPIPILSDIQVELVKQCNGPFDPDTKYCPETGFTITPFLNDEISAEYYENSNMEIRISNLDNSNEEYSYVLEYPFGPFVFYPELTGNYSVCLVDILLLNNDCDDIVLDLDYCSESNILIEHPAVVDLGVYKVCQSDLEQGVLVDEDWEGDELEFEGIFYNNTIGECGCEIIQQIEIVQIDLTEGIIELELCPQDLPYNLFEDFIIEEGEEYDGSVIEIESGSMQMDHFDLYCDSVFVLYVDYINEEDVCNQCRIPYSVDLKNLELCLPFDSSGFDFSRHENHFIHQNSATFSSDRFDRQNHAISFNGIDDVGFVPHVNRFDSYQHSISFWIRKQEDTFDETNIREGIVHKGIEGNHSKAFSITIEKHLENTFLMDYSMFQGSSSNSIRYGSFEYNRWYHVAIINDYGNIKLYIDGDLAESKSGNSLINFNSENLVFGGIQTSSEIKYHFTGELDEFRFWSRPITNAEAYFLFRPEAQFQLTSTVQTDCCASIEFHGNFYDFETPIDTVVTAGVSPTGEDSLYILNLNIEDPAPLINFDLIPEDIYLEVTTLCEEECRAIASWVDPGMNAFSDNCGIVNIEQSHYSPLELTEVDNYIEVVYQAVDNCGQISEASFIIDLSCTKTEVDLIPEPAELVINTDPACQEELPTICLGEEIELTVLRLDNTSNPVDYPDTFEANWFFEITGPLGNQLLSYLDQPVPVVVYDPEEEGEYQVCLQKITNECYETNEAVCQYFNVELASDINHGTVTICQSEILFLPDNYPQFSEQLHSLISENPEESQYKVEMFSTCNCPFSENVVLNILDNNIAEEVLLEICDTELPYSYHDLVIDQSNQFDSEEIYLSALSSLINDMGIACDSLILLSTVILQSSESFQDVSICEGEVFNGYEETGNYVEVLSNQQGCDSIINIELTVFPAHESIIDITICEGEDYEGHTEPGEYVSMFIDQFGCDSIVTLFLEVLPEDHIDCMSTSLEELISAKLKIFPNPVSNRIFVQAGNVHEIEYEVFNISGQLVNRGLYTEKGIKVDSFEEGLYILKLTKDGYLTSRKFFKM